MISLKFRNSGLPVRLFTIGITVVCYPISVLVSFHDIVANDALQTIEEVIVTAEKRDESLQDLSQAVTALTEAGIDERDLDGFVDIETLAPGVKISKNEGFKTVISIRGVGNEANQNTIANPSVSYHLDGIYVASPFALQTDFLDIARIEVLRGPQGTLFGQNSTGGALNVITTAPDPSSAYGRIELSVGNYDLSKVRAMSNVPLGDSAAMRIALASLRHSGYSTNVSLDQELDDADSKSVRVRLLWEIGPSLTVNFLGQYFDEDINGSAQKGLRDATPHDRSLSQDSPSHYELESQLYSLVVERSLGWATLKSLTSFQQDAISVVRDNDRTHLERLPPRAVIPSFVNPENDKQVTLTQEVQVVSDDSSFGGLEWVAGVFYLDTSVEILFFEQIDFGFDGVFDPFSVDEVRNFVPGDYGFISDSVPERKSVSLYAQGTYPLSDHSRLIGGARFTDDEVRSEVTNFFGRSGTDILRTHNRKMTGRVAFEHDLSTSTTMLYSSLTRGFKPGGSNLTYGRESEISPIVVLPTYEDEIVDMLEAGMKSSLLGKRLQVNTAIFTARYQNLQYHATDPEVFEGGVGNLPQSRMQGLEAEMFALLGSRWDVDLRVSAIDTEITSSHLALDNVNSDAVTNELLAQGKSLFGPDIQRARAMAITDVRGNELAKTPRITADLTLGLNLDVSPGSTLVSKIQLVHRGEFQHRIFNNPKTDRVDAYQRLNFSTKYGPTNGRWQVGFTVKNLTDERGINSQFTDVFGVGATCFELIPPRTYTLRLRIES